MPPCHWPRRIPTPAAAANYLAPDAMGARTWTAPSSGSVHRRLDRALPWFSSASSRIAASLASPRLPRGPTLPCIPAAAATTGPPLPRRRLLSARSRRAKCKCAKAPTQVGRVASHPKQPHAWSDATLHLAQLSVRNLGRYVHIASALYELLRDVTNNKVDSEVMKRAKVVEEKSGHLGSYKYNVVPINVPGSFEAVLELPEDGDNVVAVRAAKRALAGRQRSRSRRGHHT